MTREPRPLPGTVTRSRFVAAVRGAVARGRPFAAAKLGNSEVAMLRYPLLLERIEDPHRRRAYELSLLARQPALIGVFPAELTHFRRCAKRMAEDLRELDSVGVFAETLPAAMDLLEGHGAGGEPVEYTDQEPDRSIPADEDGCYLPALRGKRLLIVNPYAPFLRERANRETFEAVWAKTGKPWFEPAAVEAVSFPLVLDPATQDAYADSLELLDEIVAELSRREFDVALIGATGMGISLAAAVKRQGRVGIALGGHLQIVFGVFGERWLRDPRWERDYFNDAWTRLPASAGPGARVSGEPNYW